MAILTITKYSLLVFGAFAAVVIAAPAQAGHPDRVLHNRTPTIATEPSSATCVAGAPAISTSAYKIDYAAVAAPTTGNSYDIDESFKSAHTVGNAMTLYFGSDSDDMKNYASFKCQYTCNGTPGCVSFFGRFVQVNSTTEHFECLGFGALLDHSAFILTSQNVPIGGFNKLCR
ncbi:hypothetical protein VMCG_04569 [Cytospora schulzeri]|uniref:Apple domain-containing protein n=1 Tax=Cytospora schulzeri TaxID=448051 RepID=A0A423WRE9_9PEZI|nr:hypothetical protein VMCG_04569 [Valsa malicola]